MSKRLSIGTYFFNSIQRMRRHYTSQGFENNTVDEEHIVVMHKETAASNWIIPFSQSRELKINHVEAKSTSSFVNIDAAYVLSKTNQQKHRTMPWSHPYLQPPAIFPFLPDSTLPRYFYSWH